MENPNPNLPEEIMMEIFSRLPVKSVGRFRCLSKSWRRNLSTPKFIKSHLSSKTNQKDDFILLIGIKSLRTISTPLDEKNPVVPRDVDFPDQATEVIGCCDGLVSLLAGRNENDDDDIIFVVNPLTLQQVSFKDMPLSVDIPEVISACPYDGSCCGDDNEVSYGFGYDSCSDDYKIVKLARGHIEGGILVAFVYVYSMKKGSWKRLTIFPFDDRNTILANGNGIFANGVIHWLGYVVGGEYVIAAFDLATESFKTVVVPHNEMFGKEYILFGIRGCMFMVCPRHFDPEFEAWMMKEYGQVNSWTKFSTIPDSDQLDSSKHSLLCAIGEDEILLSSRDLTTLIVWKLTEGTTKAVTVNGGPYHILDGTAFVGSLVSPIQDESDDVAS